MRAAAGAQQQAVAAAAATTASSIAVVAALLTLVAAVAVIAFGVIATTGVYGSRMAWLLGVALPLLATATILAGLARRSQADGRGDLVTRAVLLTSLSLFGIPLALAVTTLAVYAFLFAVHGVSLLL